MLSFRGYATMPTRTGAVFNQFTWSRFNTEKCSDCSKTMRSEPQRDEYRETSCDYDRRYHIVCGHWHWRPIVSQEITKSLQLILGLDFSRKCQLVLLFADNCPIPRPRTRIPQARVIDFWISNCVLANARSLKNKRLQDFHAMAGVYGTFECDYWDPAPWSSSRGLNCA